RAAWIAARHSSSRATAFRSASCRLSDNDGSSAPMQPSPSSRARRSSTLRGSEPRWTRSSTSIHGHVAEPRHQRGLIDTSVVIDLGRIDAADLPYEIAVSAVTLAELAAGPHATGDSEERARRQDRLQRTE